jgi:hypothetical protein
MKRRGFFGALAGLVAATQIKTKARGRSPVAFSRKTPGPAWDTMVKMHALMGGDAFVRHYVAPDQFCDQLEHEMAPIAGPVSFEGYGFRSLLAWRQVRIYRPDEATALGLMPNHYEDDALYSYAPGAPGVLGPGWGVIFLEYRRNPGVSFT